MKDRQSHADCNFGKPGATDNIRPAICYKVVYQDMVTETGEVYRSYGLQGFCFEAGVYSVQNEILDITPDSLLIHEMAEKFEKNQLCCSQLQYVLEDMLA